jgi:hypothetical protein
MHLREYVKAVAFYERHHGNTTRANQDQDSAILVHRVLGVLLAYHAATCVLLARVSS